MTKLEQARYEYTMGTAKYRTNHILHVILTVLTGLLWVPVWIIITLMNNNKLEKIEENYNYHNSKVLNNKE